MLKSRVMKTVSFLWGLRKARNRRVFIIQIINVFFYLPIKLSRLILRRLFRYGKIITPPIIRQAIARKLENKPFKNTSPRMYLKSRYSIETLFQELNARNIRYVVIRWFEDLPTPREGEDIDILVDDEDLAQLKEYFTPYNNACQAFDIYSRAGVKGHDFKSIPYFPPQIAKDILQNRVFYDHKYAAPNTLHHFLSMVYHVVFHKAENSGLPYEIAAAQEPEESINQKSPDKPSDHDYKAILETLSSECKVALPRVDFVTLYDVLKQNNWLPELDTMRIMARKSDWIRRLLPAAPHGTSQPKNHHESDIAAGQLVVFIIREWAVTNNKIECITGLLREKLLDVLLVHELTSSEREKARLRIRGGKWDRGPYPVSGGEPAVIIVAYDYAPRVPDQETLSAYPYLENQNIMVKHDIRDYLNAELLPTGRTNCIHSADCESEAWHYIDHTIPQYRDHLEAERNKRLEAFTTRYPVLQTIKANGTRAKTEKIDFNGRPAIKKTFRLGCEKFAAREAYVYEKFSPICSEILPLLEKGDHYIILPWIENQLAGLEKKQLRKVLKPHATTILKTMKKFYEQEYAIIGFYPGNLLLDTQNRLYIIDFEFIYKYKNKPATFWESYDIAGIPKHFDGDLPRDHRRKGHTYANTWRSLLGPSSLYKDVI